jgi:hypothetical protein
MHRAGEAVRRQPFRQRVRLDESAVDLIGLRGQDAVQTDGTGHGRSPSAGLRRGAFSIRGDDGGRGAEAGWSRITLRSIRATRKTGGVIPAKAASPPRAGIQSLRALGGLRFR